MKENHVLVLAGRVQANPEKDELIFQTQELPIHSGSVLWFSFILLALIQLMSILSYLPTD